MNTVIEGVDFGPIWGMSGLQNFFGEGWWYHKYLERTLAMSLKPITVVAKTSTFASREGNMPLKKNLQPKEWIPRCIYVDHIRDIVLNAVNLSGPGFPYLFEQGIWQDFLMPFFLSHMTVADTFEGKMVDTELFVRELCRRYPEFKTRFGVQENISCPNTGGDLNALLEQTSQRLDLYDPFVEKGGVVILKVGVDMPIEKVVKLSQHRNCHGICVSNTIPFGKMSDELGWGPNWIKQFPNGSPLIARGFSQPGGLSGPYLNRLVVKWVRKARELGVTKHINAGGGIIKYQNMNSLYEVGADSFSIGSIVLLRPQNVNTVIRQAFLLQKTWN